MNSFTSALINPAATMTVNHGLGKKPEIVQVRIRCIANDAGSGYSAGDEVCVESTFDNVLTIPLFGWFPTTTQILVSNVNFIPGGEAQCMLPLKGGAGSASPTSVNNFQIIIYAVAF